MKPSLCRHGIDASADECSRCESDEMNRAGAAAAPTLRGILASTEARREEAMVALSFLRQLEQLAESVRSLVPEGKIAAQAVLDARAAAVEAVALWRTARAEATRRARAVGGVP